MFAKLFPTWFAKRKRQVVNEATIERLRQVYEYRADLRQHHPWGLLPPGRLNYLQWFRDYGITEYSFTPEEIDQYAAWLEADPTCGVETTYRYTPTWQAAVPNALTPNGWPKLLRYLQANFNGPWLKRVRKPVYESLSSQGVNLIGHFRHNCGVGEVASGFVESLATVGVQTYLRDVPVGRLAQKLLKPRPHDVEAGVVSILTFGASDNLRSHYAMAGLHPQADVYRIAVWFWELEVFPPGVLEQRDFIQEIWVASEFCARGASQIAEGRPVKVMWPAVRIPQPLPNARDRFQIPPEAFVVLFMFDAGSVCERKNPLALVSAFRQALGNVNNAELVLKVSNAKAYPETMGEIRNALRGLKYKIIEETLTRQDTDTLLATCDAYVSLHRSEGFGMTLAEAMLLGKPCIATNYSGNLDFMNEGNSYLVNYTMVKLEHAIGPYPAGATWAEADTKHAAELLNRIYHHPEEAREKGQKAKTELSVTLSPSNVGQRIQQRLKELKAC